jgi:hypothetical protein
MLAFERGQVAVIQKKLQVDDFGPPPWILSDQRRPSAKRPGGGEGGGRGGDEVRGETDSLLEGVAGRNDWHKYGIRERERESVMRCKVLEGVRVAHLGASVRNGVEGEGASSASENDDLSWSSCSSCCRNNKGDDDDEFAHLTLIPNLADFTNKIDDHRAGPLREMIQSFVAAFLLKSPKV